MMNNTFFMFGGFGYTKDTGFIHKFQYFLKLMNKIIPRKPKIPASVSLPGRDLIYRS